MVCCSTLSSLPLTTIHLINVTDHVTLTPSAVCGRLCYHRRVIDDRSISSQLWHCHKTILCPNRICAALRTRQREKGEYNTGIFCFFLLASKELSSYVYCAAGVWLRSQTEEVTRTRMQMGATARIRQRNNRVSTGTFVYFLRQKIFTSFASHDLM